MLRHEEAQKRLKAFHIKDWDKARIAQLGELPDKLRAAGRALFDRDADGKPFKSWEKRHKASAEAGEVLTKASARDRQRVFAVLFPKLAGLIEAGWQMLVRYPYAIDYDRKAFRAPSCPEVYRDARLSWVQNLISDLRGYDPDVVWCAAWAPHLSGGHGADQLGLLLAAAIDAGGPEGEQVFEILRESATNEHEIGGMGRHLTRALLACGRSDAWEFVEKLLLAAQRQEGLRQVILETIDECHPEAFRRMLRLILEHNLLRFSATVRAADVWFGLQWDSATPATIKKAVEAAVRFLEDPKARDEALKTEKGETLYLALWAMGVEDTAAAVAPAAALLKDPVVERRFLAMHFLQQTELPAARRELTGCLEDPDLRIALRALDELPLDEDGPDLWDRLIALRERMPAKAQELPALVWPWATTRASRREVTGELVNRLGKRPATALLPFLDEMDSYDRGQVVRRLAKLKKWDAATRDTLFRLVGDRDSWVRQTALEALKKCEVTEADAQNIEALLVKKGSELRQGVLRLLKKQKSAQALASADRLLASKKAEQRLGGLELLRALVEKKRAVAECRSRAEAFRQKYPEPGEYEQIHFEVIFDEQREKPTLDNAFGLLDASQRTRPVEPQTRKVTLCSAAAVALIQELDELFSKNRRKPVTVPGHEGPEEMLLGNMRSWNFPSPDIRRNPVEDAKARLPLYPMWKEWYENRPKKLRDSDGFELLRATAWCLVDASEWKGMQRQFGKQWGPWLDRLSNGQAPLKLKHRDLVDEVIDWLLVLYPAEGAADFLLDVIETAFASVPDDIRKRVIKKDNWQQRGKDWRNSTLFWRWWNVMHWHRQHFPAAWTEQHTLRLWQLLHWRDEPVPGVARYRPDLEYLVAACKAGLTSEADLIDHLLGPGLDDFSALHTLTRRDAPQLNEAPALVPVVQRCKDRVLEIELKRGDLPTPATDAARAIASLTGLPMLLGLWDKLGKKAPARNTWGDGRHEVMTHLIAVTYPAAEDTLEVFATQVRQVGWTQERLLQLGFVAPQWLDHVEHALGWLGLKEGVWWFLAHMPGGRSGLGDESDSEFEDDFEDDFDDEAEITARAEPVNAWERLLAERTPLTEEERATGAVDTAWFHRAYEPLGSKRWDALAEAAKYGCSDSSHKKAVLLSDVLLGKAKKADLVANIRDRKLKEPVRLLGLLPLPEIAPVKPGQGEKREAELLSRYKVLHEYHRYARSLGPMSREDAVRTAMIGLENLARTAGYPDPLRLQWAMEARELADLAQGPISATAEGVTVTLAINPQAQPELTVRRGDKPLKAVPPAVRKNAKVAALLERRTELKRSASRVKQSLESAMVRGDTFSGRELRQLFSHPLLRPLLERLVLLGEGIRGYPVAAGQALKDFNDNLEPVKPDERIRLAHPHDLFAAGDWEQWQHHCFSSERVQPFKQVFRELYVVTKQEKADGAASHRYSGQQVNPSQAMALWGSRGWKTHEEVSKTFHDAGIVALVGFRHHGWTPLQVEGLTLEDVTFHRRGDYKPIPLADVPPRIFSEVMRDCDLVVSVAHRGGVDPEASASTVEMRTSLVRETCALLHIDNYKIKSSHALIDGKLGKYSVHLGSGVVHRQPGGSLCIIPVHSQHRGRLFLPFADDDPRTAEVISKVLLLARDHEIQDPSILEQLR